MAEYPRRRTSLPRRLHAEELGIARELEAELGRRWRTAPRRPMRSARRSPVGGLRLFAPYGGATWAGIHLQAARLAHQGPDRAEQRLATLWPFVSRRCRLSLPRKHRSFAEQKNDCGFAPGSSFRILLAGEQSPSSEPKADSPVRWSARRRLAGTHFREAGEFQVVQCLHPAIIIHQFRWMRHEGGAAGVTVFDNFFTTLFAMGGALV